MNLMLGQANGVKEVTVGIMAVFDGHDGAEASDMALKLLLEYCILHTYFLLDATYFSVTSVLVQCSYIVNGIACMLSHHILLIDRILFICTSNNEKAFLDQSIHCQWISIILFALNF